MLYSVVLRLKSYMCTDLSIKKRKDKKVKINTYSDTGSSSPLRGMA